MRYTLLLTLLFYLVACGDKKPAPPTAQEQMFQQRKALFAAYGKTTPDSLLWHINQYLAQYPASTPVLVLKARVFYDVQQLDSSLLYYKKTIEQNPSYSLAYSGAGAIYNLQNNSDSAEYYLKKAIALRDSSAYTPLALAMLYVKKADAAQCRTYADSTIALRDSSPVVASGLSYLFLYLKEKKTSEGWYQTAVTNGLRDTAMFRQVLTGKRAIDEYYRLNGY